MCVRILFPCARARRFEGQDPAFTFHTPASFAPAARPMRRSFLIQAARATVAALPLGARAANDAPNYSFGIVPQQSASALARTWIPVFNVLAAHSGLGLRFTTAPDIPAFEKRLAAGAYDFAYMNPYHYTVFSLKPGYRAFAHEKGRRLRGLVVVR